MVGRHTGLFVLLVFVGIYLRISLGYLAVHVVLVLYYTGTWDIVCLFARVVFWVGVGDGDTTVSQRSQPPSVRYSRGR
jgi:hypothetical protein